MTSTREVSAASSGVSVVTDITVIPTDTELRREVVNLVDGANQMRTEADGLFQKAKGRVQRAIDLLKARRERDPKTFQKFFDATLKQITDRRRRSEIKLAVADGRDFQAEEAKRQADMRQRLLNGTAPSTLIQSGIKHPTPGKPMSGGNDVDTEASAEARKKVFEEPMSVAVAALVDQQSVAEDIFARREAKLAEYRAMPLLDLAREVHVRQNPLNTRTLAERIVNGEATPAGDPLAAFKLATDALPADDIADAVKYLEAHVRKVITPELRAAQAKASAEADKADEAEETEDE